MRALSSPTAPAEQAAELIPAYQHLLIWFSTVTLDHAGKAHQIPLQKEMNSHKILLVIEKKKKSAFCQTTGN